MTSNPQPLEDRLADQEFHRLIKEANITYHAKALIPQNWYLQERYNTALNLLTQEGILIK